MCMKNNAILFKSMKGQQCGFVINLSSILCISLALEWHLNCLWQLLHFLLEREKVKGLGSGTDPKIDDVSDQLI